MKTFSLLVVFVSLLGGVSLAQSNCKDGWCWGENEMKAKEHYALFADGLELKDYTNSVAPLDWLIENVPNLNETVYVKGKQLYTALIEYEKRQGKDQVKIKVFEEKLSELQKLREKYFPG